MRTLYSNFFFCVQIAPAYEGLELGIGESILMKAVADSTGRTLAMVKSSFQELGDLGMQALFYCILYQAISP